MDKRTVVKDIAETLSNSKSILMTIHESPDGDAVGSLLALYNILKLMKKDVVMYAPNVIPMRHRFLRHWEEVSTDTKVFEGMAFDVLLMLDCGARDRSGEAINSFKGYKKLVNIDHHISNIKFGDLNLVDAHSSCTGEEVFHVIKELLKMNSLGLLPVDVATALLTALYDDTGGMRYSSTTSTTLNVAAELVASGANCSYVSENLFFNISREKMELTSHVLSTLTFEADGRIAYVVMRKKDLETTGAISEDSEGLIDLPRSIYGVEVAFFIKEVSDNKFKASFRSRGKVDVNKFCSNFGGGGHKVAAGCTINGTLEHVTSTIVSELKKLV